MGNAVIIFDNFEIEKQKLHYSESPISIYNVDINKIVLPNKAPFGKKRFKDLIGYENDYEKVMPLCIKFPKMNAYRKDTDETKYMFFLKKITNCYRNIVKFAIKSAMLSKRIG